MAWALIGATACLLLAFAKGHPPGLAFVPVVIIVWVAGHGLLWLSRKAAVRGKHLVGEDERATTKWPVPVILLVLACGFVFFVGLALILSMSIFRSGNLTDLGTILAFWIPPSVCFFGILLRRNWARILAGCGLLVLAALPSYEIVLSLKHGYTRSLTGWGIVIVVISVLLFLGQHILRSTRIKAFFRWKVQG